MAAHMAQSRTRCGASHAGVIIHAAGPLMAPYMSRAIATTQIQHASGTMTSRNMSGSRGFRRTASMPVDRMAAKVHYATRDVASSPSDHSRPTIRAVRRLLRSGIGLTTIAVLQTPAPDLDDLLTRAAAYEQRFEQAFSTIVADEHYEQRRSGFSPELDARPRLERAIQSETLFLWIPEEQSWLTARNVQSVDGQPVDDSATRLERLLSDTSADWVTRVRRLRDEGARFNLGPIQRNFS